MLRSDYERHSRRMAEIQTQIETLGEALKAQGALPRLDEAVSGVTLFNMARLIGETGPLGDFPSRRALLRYAGLNIRERKSGTYRGHNRISKKGRSLLRKVLGQMTFPLLRRIHLYGDYYHEKVNKGMLRQKAKVARTAYGPCASFCAWSMLWPTAESASTRCAFEGARASTVGTAERHSHKALVH